MPAPRKRSELLLALSAALVLLSAAAAASVFRAGQSDPTKANLMRVKKGYAHRLLDAVVLQDYPTIREEAFRLKAVAETEDWSISTNEAYVRNTDAFIRAADALLRSAEEKNAEGTALAYMDLTLQCVQCHRHMKEQPLTP